jgi:hypothetical protein
MFEGEGLGGQTYCFETTGRYRRKIVSDCEQTRGLLTLPRIQVRLYYRFEGHTDRTQVLATHGITTIGKIRTVKSHQLEVVCKHHWR